MSRNIKYIFIHCTAGYGNSSAVQNYHINTLKWKTGGYHRIVESDGSVANMYDFNRVTNGVKYYNSDSIHISYVGGVERSNINKALDSRSDKQKESIIKCILEAYDWCSKNGQDTDDIIILGHRDISPDKNLNGIIDPNERIKECPSFDAIDEYWYLMGSKALNRLGKSKTFAK